MFLSLSFVAVNAKCNNKISLSQGSAIVLDGKNLRGKPLHAFTMTLWMNLYDGYDHSIFSVLNSKNEGKCGYDYTRRDLQQSMLSRPISMYSVLESLLLSILKAKYIVYLRVLAPSIYKCI